MKQDMSNKILSWVLLGTLTLSTVFVQLYRPGPAQLTFLAARAPGETVIIDAGHGGEDGGAVSISGVPESGINLAIAQKLDALLGLYGVQTKLLRESDISLHDGDAKTLRQKKVSDLHNRVDIIEKTENATLISIHQNIFQSPKYRGAQVFYANDAQSLPFATLTQRLLKEVLDPSNLRQPAKIPDSVYLMKHITCPAILVECGFLSNREEDQKLQTSAYQTRISLALAGSFLQFQGMESPPLAGGEP